MAEITLDFLAKQLDRLIATVATLRDDIVVLAARIDRVDARTEATSRAILDELRAMHSRSDRLARRVDKLEDATAPQR